MDNIIKIQQGFARKAIVNPEHRFDNLYNLLKQDVWLNAALEAVLANVGARTGGVDGITRQHFNQEGYRARFLSDLKTDLATSNYQPQPVKRRYIPKGNGKVRPLGIPTMKDRVVQMLLKMMLEPIFESDFLNCSIGFRPKRRTMDAIAVCYQVINPRNTYFWVIEGDIRSCFDRVNHRILLRLINRRIKDPKVMNLIGRLLKAGVMEEQIFRRSSQGTPQGGIVSPLLANIYLHELDRWWWEKYGNITRHARAWRRKKGLSNCLYVRYADDWIVLCNGTKAQAEAIRDEIQLFLQETLHLELSEEKTLVTHACDGFDFLGFHIQHYPARQGQKAITLVRPTEKSIRRLKDKIRDMTSRKNHNDPPLFKFKAINAVLRGWKNYYRHCNVSQLVGWLDHWVHLRVAKWLVIRHKSCYREILKTYLKQEERRKNLAVKRSDGSDLFLFKMQDVHLTPYRRQTVTHPYLQGDPIQTAVIDPEVSLPDNPWNGRTTPEHAAWRNRRDEILARDNYRCRDCGQQTHLDIHHLKPKRNGGTDDPDNLISLCEDCHVKRGNYGRPRKNG